MATTTATTAVKRGRKPSEDRIRIFDTTLRDGEQCPGGSMNIEEKLQVARMLKLMNVDVIEAGFPIASPGDFEAVQAVAKQIKGPVIAGLARSLEKDIVRAADALKPAGSRGRIHVFLATSKIHRDKKLKKTPGEIIAQAIEAVKFAKSLCKDIEFSPEDAARTEWDFLAEVVEAVIDAGAATVNIPDTVGYTIPNEFYDLISHLKSTVPNINKAVISVHCHNDLGLAVANSLAAVQAGARQVECTVNGIGERAGNASIEEFVMTLKTRADVFKNIQVGIDATKFVPASRLVSSVTGLAVQRNKAIVGENAFAHEAGIHQDGVLKDRQTYEIMTPASVGLTSNTMVIGKHSGRHAIMQRVKDLGYSVTKEEGERIYNRIIQLADKKKNVYDADIDAIVSESFEADEALYVMDNIQVSTGNRSVPTATVTLIDANGNRYTDAAIGDGPINAAYNAIDRITGLSGKLVDFRIDSATEGRDALGVVSVVVQFDAEEVRARGSSTDIIEAAALAYLTAQCRSKTLREKIRAKQDTQPKPRAKPKKE